MSVKHRMKACSNPASDNKGDCEKDEPAASQKHLLQEMLQKQMDTSSSSLPRLLTSQAVMQILEAIFS